MKKKQTDEHTRALEEEIASLSMALEEQAEEMKKKEALIEEYLNAARMVQADFENYKKRSMRDAQRQACLAKESVLSPLLEIRDNFERALSLADSAEVPTDFLKGIDMIYGQLCRLLEAEGVTPIACVGKAFDPYYHEALFMDEGSCGDAEIVCEEYQKGYLYQDKVLRHAKVKVRRGDAPPDEEQQEGD